MAVILREKGGKQRIFPRIGGSFSVSEICDAVGAKFHYKATYLVDGRIMLSDMDARDENKGYNAMASGMAKKAILGDVLVCQSYEFE